MEDNSSFQLADNTTGYFPADNSTEVPFDVSAFLETHMGSRYRSLLESVTLSIIYSLILLTGVVGNVCTCIVIVRNAQMHTATNYYLFSLATSDVLTLILGKSTLQGLRYSVQLYTDCA